jgi:tetratricopeptide (TPR) repeat protein
VNQVSSDLARAYAYFQRGEYRGAEAVCREGLGRTPGNANLMHLLGLVRNHVGDTGGAEQLMRMSIDIQPRQPDFHANLGNLLHKTNRLPEAERVFRNALSLMPDHRGARLGLARTLTDLNRHSEAEAQYRAVLALQPRDPPIWASLALSLGEQQRWLEAEQAYRHALEIEPNYPLAHHNLGSLLVRLERAEEALEALNQAERLGARGFEMSFNRGRALLQLYKVDEAVRAFEDAVALNPRHGEAQLNLARLRFMQGDRDFSRDIVAALAANREDTQLQGLLADVLRRAGDLKNAEALLRNLISRGGQPRTRATLAAVLYEGGRLKEAEAEALEAAAGAPNDTMVIDTLVSLLLSRGRPEEAQAFIRTQRARRPLDQSWLAYEATAARLLGQPAYQQLFDYERLVRVYDIEPPPGWSSIEELNAAVLHALTQRHKFAIHPLDQSLRNGSQTARSLFADPDPAIQAILKAFEAPIEQYRHEIGADPAHPFSARNTAGARITGAWSVQLRREGFHVNHFHPEGWISSAYYVSVPEEVNDAALKSGWIKFGETRYPTPGAKAEHFVQPKPGRLVLFPSYMWHGTNPIHGSESRTTIAFDALPLPPR